MVVNAELMTKISEQRTEKSISLDALVQAGISKSKWYRYINGETDISVADLHKLMDLFSVSFAELMADNREANLVVLNIDELATRNVAELQACQDEIKATYGYKHFGAWQMAVDAIDVLIARRQGRSTAVQSRIVYEELNAIDAFTMHDMKIAALVGQDLDVESFFNIYRKFVEGISAFKDYMPSVLFEMSLMMHLTALNKFILEPSVPRRSLIEFVFEALEYQPSRSSYVEMYILRRFVERCANYMLSENPLVLEQLQVFMDSAARFGVETLTMNGVSVSLLDIWHKFSEKDQAILTANEDGFAVPTYAELNLAPRVKHLGELLHIAVRAKHVRIADLNWLGFSRAKIYRMYDKSDVIYLEDLFPMMHITGLEPGDIDAVLTSLPDAEYALRFNVSKLAPEIMPEVAAKAELKYQETHKLADLETYFEVQTIAEIQRTSSWYGTDRALKLAERAADTLQGLDKWDENELRIVKLAFMAVDNATGVREWIQMIHKSPANSFHSGRVYVNYVVDGVEYAIFRAMFLGNGELLHLLISEARKEADNDEHIARYTAWRWRMMLYDIYDGFLESPLGTIRKLSSFFVDYEVLVGSKVTIRRYQLLFSELWRRCR